MAYRASPKRSTRQGPLPWTSSGRRGVTYLTQRILNGSRPWTCTMSTSQARNGGCLWAGQYFVPTEEIERQYPWGAPETGAENPATNQSTSDQVSHSLSASSSVLLK